MGLNSLRFLALYILLTSGELLELPEGVHGHLHREAPPDESVTYDVFNQRGEIIAQVPLTHVVVISNQPFWINPQLAARSVRASRRIE